MPRKKLDAATKVDIWMPTYISDKIANTGDMTGDQYRAYDLIEMHQWRHGPMTMEQMENLSRLQGSAWSTLQALLKRSLSSDENGLFFFPAVRDRREEWLGRRIKAQERASKGGVALSEKRKREQEANKTGSASSTPQATPQAQQTTPKGLLTERPAPSPSEPTAPPSASLQGERAADGHATPVDSEGEDTANKGENETGGPTDAPKPVQATRGAKRASAPRVGVEPGTLQEHLRRHGNGRRSTGQDTRFLVFKDHLRRYHAAANGGVLEAVPWGLREDRALVTLLSTEPHLTVEELSIRLGHRLDAIKVCLERPLAKGNVNARDSIAIVLNDKFPLFTDGAVNAFGDKLNL